MKIKNILKEKNISIYQLSKLADVPYTTCNDIVNNKVGLEKCNAETVYKIAETLGVTMEELLRPYLIKRCGFENFKSAVCHRLKELGDIDFLIDTYESKDIELYQEKEWWPECLYLLAMVDYISKENGVPLCSEYNELRKYKIKEIMYPAGVRALSLVTKSDQPLQEAWDKAIPEFKRFNIVESEIRNVI